MRADNEFHRRRTIEDGDKCEEFMINYMPNLAKGDGIHADLIDVLSDEWWEIKSDKFTFRNGMGNRVNVIAETVVSTSSKKEMGWVLRLARRIVENKKIADYLAFVNLEDETILVLDCEKFIRFVCRTIGVVKTINGYAYNRAYLERAKNAGWLVNNHVTGNSEGEFLLIPLEQIREQGIVVEEIYPKKKINIKIANEQIDSNKLKQKDTEILGGDNFCHLHVHSQYSLLDAVPTPMEIARKAHSLGQPGVAITDHGYMFASYKHQQACNEFGIKAIHGFEAYVVEDRTQKGDRFCYHVTLLAMNEQGWKNLITLNTIGGKDGFYYKPRIDFELLFKYNEGIIILSGCSKSPISYHFGVDGRDLDKAVFRIRQFKEVFGDRFYNEIMHVGYEEYDEIVPEIIGVAESEGIPTVVTNDCHYTEKEHAEIQTTMIKIGMGPRRNDNFEFNIDQLYMKSREEVIVGPITEQMADRSLEIAERINFKLEFEGYKFPKFDITESSDYQQFIKETEEVK